MSKRLLLTGLFLTVVGLHATAINFAGVQYRGMSGSNVTYSFQNTASGQLGVESGLAGAPSSIPITFTFQGLGGVPAQLQGNLDAHLTLNTNSANPGSLGGAISITLDTPYSGKNILLQATFTGALNGISSSSAALDASSVVYSSDFLGFAGGQNSISFTFFSVAPAPATSALCVTCTYLNAFNGFNASGNGFFTANHVAFVGAPEPSAFVLAGAGILLLVIGNRRKRKPSSFGSAA